MKEKGKKKMTYKQYTKMARKITQRQSLPIEKHEEFGISQIQYPRNSYLGIKLPILEMTDPYYPYSHLATSVFHGYYFLFFMFSVTFFFVYPLLHYLDGHDLFGMTVITLVQTNILWDIASVFLFTFLALIFTQLGTLPKIAHYPFLLLVACTFLGGGFFIVRSYDMYFTDRIFIVVFSWAFGAKTLTFIGNKNGILKQLNKQDLQRLEKQKQINKFYKKLLFFISPIVSYERFVIDHNPALKIHYSYVFTKFGVSFICLLVNNITFVKFIGPACQSDLSFVALMFKLIPLVFYINISLYYMVMDNVLAAAAELTRIQTRIFYLDWWNANTIFEFLEKWCLLMTESTNLIIPNQSRRTKNAFNVLILLLLLLTIFGTKINFISLSLFMMIEIAVFFLGGIQLIQNNYIVHILTMAFTPFILALQVKYQMFD